MTSLSPLEELSTIFPVKDLNHADYWNERIMDDVENKTLYIVPAGYTFNTSDEIPRAYYYRSIWKQTVSMNSEKSTYPIGQNTHSIILESEPHNPHDRYALKIKIIFHYKSSVPDMFELGRPQDIGYVPKSISRILTKNRHQIINIKLVNIYANLDKSLFFSRLAFSYAKLKRIEPKPSIKRFSLIMED